MLAHPFFKYSFIFLLMIDLSYTAALSLMIMSAVDMDALIGALIWFVTFYWLPVWAAAVIILTIREKGIHNTFLDWLLAVTLMALGNTATDNILPLLYEQYPRMGVFVILNGILWGSGIYFISRYLESKKSIAMEQQARKAAQLSALRYQLNPHFMFNSLNTISAYIHTKPDVADKVLHELADILRYSLDTAEVKSISLKNELAIIDKYFNIEKARFGERLVVNLDVAEELMLIEVPPLLIQPIIENSVKHNAKQTMLTIDIKIKIKAKSKLSIQQNLLEIIITDNGKGFSDDILAKGFGKGIGMKNLQQRMAQIEYGKVNLSNQEGAVVTLEMAV